MRIFSLTDYSEDSKNHIYNFIFKFISYVVETWKPINQFSAIIQMLTFKTCKNCSNNTLLRSDSQEEAVINMCLFENVRIYIYIYPANTSVTAKLWDQRENDGQSGGGWVFPTLTENPYCGYAILRWRQKARHKESGWLPAERGAGAYRYQLARDSTWAASQEPWARELELDIKGHPTGTEGWMTPWDL